MSKRWKKDESSQPDQGPKIEESLRREAQEGMPGLVSDRQRLAEYLKKGGRSGISHDFGKPAVVDSSAEKRKTGDPAAGSDRMSEKDQQDACDDLDRALFLWTTSSGLDGQKQRGQIESKLQEIYHIDREAFDGIMRKLASDPDYGGPIEVEPDCGPVTNVHKTGDKTIVLWSIP